jgi:NitT/TauT family transport system ATP-binding protein
MPVIGSVGYVFQTPSLIPWKSIRENALFGAEVRGRERAEIASRCDDLLAIHGLGGFETAYPSALSGGMQQRVSIIRAVLSGAKTILLDEPFSNSDFIMRRALQEELSRLVTDESLVAIMVTHDLEEAVRIADRLFVLSDRPARVNETFEIAMPRNERLKGSASVIREMANYVERLESAFSKRTQPVKGAA